MSEISIQAKCTLLDLYEFLEKGDRDMPTLFGEGKRYGEQVQVEYIKRSGVVAMTPKRWFILACLSNKINSKKAMATILFTLFLLPYEIWQFVNLDLQEETVTLDPAAKSLLETIPGSSIKH